MSEKLVIRITDIDSPVEWAVLDAQGNRMGFPQKGQLAIAAPLARQRTVVIIVSGPEVTTHNLALAVKSKKQLQQAVPFALEDNLSEDVDDLHFAMAKSRDNNIQTCVCRKIWLKDILSRLEESGIKADVITPDFQVIDPAINRPVLVVDGNIVTYCDESKQWSLPISTFDEIAPAISMSMTATDRELQFYCGEINASQAERIKKMLGVVSAEEDGKPHSSLLTLFTAGVHAGNGTNLLQGSFKTKGTRNSGPVNWKIPASLAAVWFLLFSGNILAERLQFGNLDKELDTRIEEVFHAALPNVRTIVNPRAQFEQELNRRSDNSLSSDFLALLAISGVAISKEPGTSFNSVSYNNGQIEVSVNAGNVQALDNIKQYLADQHGLTVEIMSADTREDTVVGQLKISEGG